MARPRKRRLLLISLALLIAGAAAGTVLWWRGRPVPREVAVLFNGSDDGLWLQVRDELVRQASAQGWATSAEDNGCRVELPGGPVVFRWYPAVGEVGMRRRVRELCERPRPPLALVGPETSTLAAAVVKELDAHDPDRVPVLLLSGATKADLLAPDRPRRFRFAYANRAQAAKVLQALGACYPRAAQVWVVEVRGMEYAEDLVRSFCAALPKPPDRVFHLEGALGGFDQPTDQERELARAVRTEVRAGAGPSSPPLVLFVPIPDVYRRLCSLLDPETARRVVVLSGDLLTVAYFRDYRLNRLTPDHLPATLFFSHVRPDDQPGETTERDMVRSLLPALAGLAPRDGPAALASALARSGRFDKAGELADGGGGWVCVRPEDYKKSPFRPLTSWDPAPK